MFLSKLSFRSISKTGLPGYCPDLGMKIVWIMHGRPRLRKIGLCTTSSTVNTFKISKVLMEDFLVLEEKKDIISSVYPLTSSIRIQTSSQARKALSDLSLSFV